MGGDKPSDFATGIPADSELWRGDSRSQCHPSFMGATGVTITQQTLISMATFTVFL